MAGVVMMTAVPVLFAAWMFISWLDSDDAPVTLGTWLWAAGGFGIGAAMFTLGLRLLPRSPHRAPKGGW